MSVSGEGITLYIITFYSATGCTDFTGRGMLSFMADKTWQELSNWFPMFANPTLDGVFFMDQPLTRMINKQVG